MSAVALASLPADILAALRSVFGDAPIEGLAHVGGGFSGAVRLSFTARGARYLVRRGSLERSPQAFACMRIAAERGVAPELLLADTQTGICIMQMIDGEPIGRVAERAPQRVERVAAALKRLHEGPAFPAGASLRESLAYFEAQIRTHSGQPIPEEITRALDAALPCIARFAGTAPCHNDLNPGNVIETDERVYLIDWDMAGAGDPFIDLAQLGVFGFSDPDRRSALLDAYLGRKPNDDEAARALVTRVVALGFYTVAFLHVTALAGLPRDASEGLPFGELLRSLSTNREKTNPAMVAAALARATREEVATDAFVAAVGRM